MATSKICTVDICDIWSSTVQVSCTPLRESMASLQPFTPGLRPLLRYVLKTPEEGAKTRLGRTGAVSTRSLSICFSDGFADWIQKRTFHTFPPKFGVWCWSIKRKPGICHYLLMFLTHRIWCMKPAGWLLRVAESWLNTVGVHMIY